MYTRNVVKALRQQLASGRILVAPGAFDAWSAKVVEQYGFAAVYMTGYGASASVLGMPDLGLMSGTEMADHARRLAHAVSVPLIADADTGFGGALNVVRTVREYINAGAAAIQLEDQLAPKKCGHMENKQVVAAEDMVERIRAAVQARGDDGLVIVARTDARATHDLDEALRRAERYFHAGADVLFVEAPRSEEEMHRICTEFKGQLLVANMVEAGKTPYLKTQELDQMGYAIAIYPATTLFAARHAVGAALDELRTVGRVQTTPLSDFPHFNDSIGLPQYLALAERIGNGN